jgi:hypothetical protein
MQLNRVFPLRVEYGKYDYSAEHGRQIYKRDDRYHYFYRECCFAGVKQSKWASLDENQVPGLSDAQKEMLNAVANDNETIRE